MRCRKFIHFSFLILFPLWFAKCLPSGLQPGGLGYGENVEVQFNGPATISYQLQDGTEQSLNVTHQEEFILINTFDDGDFKTPTNGEGFVAYFRLTHEGPKIYFGPDPDLNKLDGSMKVYTADQIEEYNTNSQFIFLNRDGGYLNDSIPLSLNGNFSGIIIRRWGAKCIDSAGRFLFEIDAKEGIDSCFAPNKIVRTGSLKEYPYTKEEIAALMEGDVRSIIMTRGSPVMAHRAPFVFQVKNISAGQDSIASNDRYTLDTEDKQIERPSQPTAAPGCSLRVLNK
ncbi:MAG: hypothetical protein R3257_03550 [bacterium]|nr:hypothetical protein [bacterium]